MNETDFDTLTIEANHNGWRWCVGIAGCAYLITDGHSSRKTMHWPEMLLRKRPGVWCEPGDNQQYENVGATLEAAWLELERQAS